MPAALRRGGQVKRELGAVQDALRRVDDRALYILQHAMRAPGVMAVLRQRVPVPPLTSSARPWMLKDSPLLRIRNCMDTLIDLWHRLTDVEAIVRWGGYVASRPSSSSRPSFLSGSFCPATRCSSLPGCWLLSRISASSLLPRPLAVRGRDRPATRSAITSGGRRAQDLHPRGLTLFNKKHLMGHAFYEKHGGKTIVLARFMPIIRTFAPVVAGVAEMRYRDFVFYNVFGGLLWVWTMLFTGYFLGRWVPGIDRHIEKVILVVIFLSILPGIIHWWNERRRAPAPAGPAPTDV